MLFIDLRQWGEPFEKKYIQFSPEQIDFDTKMKRLQAEMRNLLQQEEASKYELKALFEKLGYAL